MNRTRLLSLVLVAVLEASAFVATPLAAAQAPPATPAGPAPAGRGPAPVVSPEVGADKRVTFRLRAPNASEVAVAIAGKRLPMQKDEQGVWSLTTDPMVPDIYTYSFVLDGASMNDPSNRQVQTSFGSFQSMFMVPGPAAWLPARGDCASCISFGSRERRPRLLRLHAARLRRAPFATISRALSAARVR